ncbi:MAG: DUF3253 domain-containing protein [Chthoniobacter sp.]
MSLCRCKAHPNTRAIRSMDMPTRRASTKTIWILGDPLSRRAMSEESVRIREVLRALAIERGPEKTFCPSEAARRLDAKRWRPWMAKVREAAAQMVEAGELKCTQRGASVDPMHSRGPIRLGLR